MICGQYSITDNEVWLLQFDKILQLWFILNR